MNAVSIPLTYSAISGSDIPKPKLLDQLRGAARHAHIDRRIEDSYVDWVRRFIVFHRLRHPSTMGQPELAAFLKHLAVSEHASRSVQAEVHLRACNGPIRVLEVGPGTGALTWEIVRYIRPQDQFDVVELNAGFVSALRQRFERDWHFRRVADRTRILHMPVQELGGTHSYDFVISGLPLNSFPSELVRAIFQSFVRLIKPGGVLRFFEYLWIRDVRRLFAPVRERRRLVRVGSLIERYLDRYEFRRDTVVVNLPPALVHHLRLYG